MERNRKKSKRTTQKIKKSKRRLYKRKLTNRKYNGGENIDKIIIIMLWMEGCGHCVELKKTWILLKNELKHFASFIDMEARRIDHNLLNKYSIESPRGFPTLVKIKNGVVCGEPPSRDINELRMWIKS